MRCESEIHKVPGQFGRERMDLHCFNRVNSGDPNFCRARCHMGVITEDPKVWECHEYNFEFRYDNEAYYLSSHSNLVDTYNQHRDPGEATTLSIKKKFPRRMALSKGISYPFVTDEILFTLPYFMPLSTGDDMHEKAWELFHRLRNLIIYS